jgi:hypothetical protein
MQRLEVSGAVRPLYGSLGFKGLRKAACQAVSLQDGMACPLFAGGRYGLQGGEWLVIQ